ncbi:fibropellin-1 [Patella vulgata]|uniref:fibropellin-1 n=1 Tax=Patella vulgata TaxID=6465 RepID=UPI0021806892|nr:fibropellin-1 [Patella vulgata]
MYVLWLVGIFAIVVSVSGHGKRWTAPGQHLKGVSCRKVKEANLCHSCCKDPCESVECLNGGKCVRGICECTCGYSGPDCGVDSCNNRCLNNATCNNGICDCPPMFSGEDCVTKLEPVDLCENITCVNNSQCISGICKCTPGYVGDNCDVNLCEITDCPRDTTLCVPILAPGGYTCSCVRRDEFPSRSPCSARSIITTIKTYGNNLNVTTPIPGVPDKSITISFIDDFQLHAPNDYLEIEGTRYSGFTTPADITLSPGTGTQVRFVTDNSVGSRGYRFTYQYIDTVSDSNPCKNGGTFSAQETCNCMAGFEGTNCEFPPIIIPPINYAAASRVLFTLPGFPEKDLVLTFADEFSIETTDGNCDDILRNECMEDYVEIEGTKYCGGVAPEPITIPTGNGTTVRFVSNEDGQCPIGFKLTYVYRDP